MKRILILLLAWFALQVSGASQPNIVYIICDDLGYGDVHCLNPEHGKIDTPHTDKLASQGMIFTDAHSGSSVCTPTRYGIMTGRYSWRTRLQKGVVTGFAPSLIDKDRPTVASFLKSQGYNTAIVGKWHLDFEYLDPATGKAYRQKDHKTPPVGARIPDGPVHRGFDYYHGFHHARNMDAVIENDHVIEHDAEINMLPRLTRKSVEYINSRAGNKQPFFLYVPLGSPHTPILPSKDWQGKSGLGAYGDFVMQTDNVVGEITAALQRNGQADNTLVIFTSDNGCSKAAGIPQLAEQGHIVSAHLRGSKADLWDGGHRIPFIVRWPGKVQPGSQSDQLICLTDLFATLGEITGADLPADSCEDSVSFLPALSSQPIASTRHGVIHHSYSGHFAYRQGRWKLLLARASGGWTSPKENEAAPGSPPAQLYDMTADVGEQHNLYAEKPEVVNKLFALLEDDVHRGRSTKGPQSDNDVANDKIVLWKSGKEPTKDKPAAKPKKKAAKRTATPKFEGKESVWNGYSRYDFQVDGRNCYVVTPKKPAPGNPWVWRARFPGFHIEADLLLLERGFHIAHMDTGGMLGSPGALDHWDKFYEELTAKHGLAPKVALEAVSRGGLFAYRWAARHPNRVACIYADTPVCDFKSWPLGQGSGVGSEGTWKTLLKEYGFAHEEALAFDGNPIDSLKPIAKAKIPLLHIISLNDVVVPPAENTLILVERYRKLGGSIEIIEVQEGTEKSNGHHFDHPNPNRVADFIEQHTKTR